MDETPKEPPRTRAGLAAALRAARSEDAERSEVLADLRMLQLARLGLLRDALEPILAQIPPSIDLFDVGLMPGDPPRLFIDMIAFVEMSRDRRRYTLIQDRRHGRTVLAEVDTLDDAVDAITAYIARRLVERDKALASDTALPLTTSRAPAPAPDGTQAAAPPIEKPGARRWLGQGFWFVVETLGLLVLLGAALFGLRQLWTVFHLPGI